MEYLWRWFCELTDWRESGGFGVGALSHQEVESWARLMRVELFPAEVWALRRMDRAFREWLAEERRKSEEPQMGTPQDNSLAEGLKDLKRQRDLRRGAGR